MCNDYLKVSERDSVAKVPTPAVTTARAKAGYVAVLPEEIGSTAQIHVGDARKVIERFFRKRSIATSAAGGGKSTIAADYAATRSLLRNKICNCEV